MKRNLLFFVLAFVLCLGYEGISMAEQETFSCYLSKGEIVLKSAGTVFVISSSNGEIIRIKDSASVSPYYRFMREPEKTFVLSGRHLKSCSLLKDNNQRKIAKAVFSSSDDLQLHLILMIKKELPCLFAKFFLQNTGDAPLSLGIEWFANRRFREYLAEDKEIYEIPEKIAGVKGVDMTQGLMGKINWQSIGISPYDKWLYLLPGKSLKRGLGIVVILNNKPTFFGIRGDKLVYWGERRVSLEEGERIGNEFILVPARSSEEFNQVIKQISQ